MLNEKRLLVTGSTGMIGQALVFELLTKNAYTLRLPVRNISEARKRFSKAGVDKAIEIIDCDLQRCSQEDFDQLNKNCEAVIHLAALVHKPEASEEEYALVNVKMTELLIQSALKQQVSTFVFLSTSAVYGEGPFYSVEENSTLCGSTPYAVSKISCENILGAAQKFRRTIILRPSLVFGEGDRGNLIKLIKAISGGRYVQIGAGETLKSIIYARDLARAIMLCIEQLHDGEYILNVANPDAVSMNKLSNEIWHALGKGGRIPSVPRKFLMGVSRLGDKFMPGRLPVNEEQIKKLTTETTLDVEKLISLTNFQPDYTLAAALRAEIKWAKDHKLIS